MVNVEEKLEFAELTKQTGAVLGISATHIQSSTKITYNANKVFPLCSTYKLPIAVALLQQVEQKKLNLIDQLSIHAQDLRSSLMSTLNQLDYSVPVQMSVLNLLAFMLQESCNSATDALLKLIGGPSVVMQHLNKIGINNLRVDCSAFELLCALAGIKANNLLCTLEEFKILASQVTEESLNLSRAQLRTDPRDTGTPAAMTELLIKLYNNEILDETHSNLLLKLMRRCKIGSKRIMGLLPSNAQVAHKTGTASGYTLDAGIIYLPENLGCIAISVFLEDSGKHLEQSEYIIAEAAKRIYDYFTTKRIYTC